MDVIKAVKANKSYSIAESEKKRYLSQGYDIYVGGKLAERSAKSTVSLADYEKLEGENKKLKSEISKIKKGEA